MPFLYSLGIFMYGVAMRIASVFHPKAKLWVRGRRAFFSNLPEKNKRETYWFHCASLGEFDQALPVMEEIKKSKPTVFLLVTFYSPSGFLHYHTRNHQADYVCYLPLDTKSNARNFISHFRPVNTFFVKYEFWGNFIFEAKRSGSKVYSISAIFRPNQLFFRNIGSYFQSILGQFDHFFLQNKESADLLSSIGIDRFTVTGDTRFDRVLKNKLNLITNPLIEAFSGNDEIFIIGSSWPEDEDILIPLINNRTIGRKVIIAPHDVSENHIRQITRKLEVPFQLYSQLEAGKSGHDETVLIIDSIGQLTNAYYFGSFAYVGGGFSGNLHNILEPAVFGLPVIFGPKHSRFPEAQMFVTSGIGFSVKNLEEFIQYFVHVEQSLENLKNKTIELVEHQAGASLKIMKYLDRHE
jgi:3-deoxy-D-manno-octulosonic-acid transferase